MARAGDHSGAIEMDRLGQVHERCKTVDRSDRRATDVWLWNGAVFVAVPRGLLCLRSLKAPSI